MLTNFFDFYIIYKSPPLNSKKSTFECSYHFQWCDINHFQHCSICKSILDKKFINPDFKVKLMWENRQSSLFMFRTYSNNS